MSDVNRGKYTYNEEGLKLIKNEIFDNEYFEAYKLAAEHQQIEALNQDYLNRLYKPIVSDAFQGQKLYIFYEGLKKATTQETLQGISRNGETTSQFRDLQPFIEVSPHFQDFLDRYWTRVRTTTERARDFTKETAEQLKKGIFGKKDSSSRPIVNLSGLYHANHERRHTRKSGPKPKKYWEDAEKRILMYGTLMRSLAGLPNSKDPTLKSLRRAAQKLNGNVCILLPNPEKITVYRTYLDSIIRRRDSLLYEHLKEPVEYKKRAVYLEKYISPGRVRYYDVYPHQSFTIVDNRVLVYVKFPTFERNKYTIFECERLESISIFDSFEVFFNDCWGSVDPEQMRSITSDEFDEPITLDESWVVE